MRHIITTLSPTASHPNSRVRYTVSIGSTSAARMWGTSFTCMKSSGHDRRKSLPHRDGELIQIVDSALADATHRSGEWLLCRPGCTQCCHGVFAISQLDALRLLAGLEQIEEARAVRVRDRARESMARIAAEFPGNPLTGILDQSDKGQEAFQNFANDEPCPALDPVTGNCDLYEFRPMTCRVFGPPVRIEEGFSVCELCFQGATAAQVAAGEMKPDPDELEVEVIAQAESITGLHGETIVAFCLALMNDH
jgi:Fe-S-cluster containining protein